MDIICIWANLSEQIPQTAPKEAVELGSTLFAILDLLEKIFPLKTTVAIFSGVPSFRILGIFCLNAFKLNQKNNLSTFKRPFMPISKLNFINQDE